VPLTARHAGATIDTSSCRDEDFEAVRKQRPRAVLICPGCSASMQAVRSSLGSPFFRHDVEQPRCPSNGETAVHRWLKTELAHAIRRAGWTANLEVPSDLNAGDSERWRADVMATDQESGRRVAFEVQISGQTVDVGQYRTERYARDGIDTFWVAAAKVWWMWKIPGFQIESSDEDKQLSVTRGIATFGHHDIDIRRGIDEYTRTMWLTAPKVSLDSAVDAILRGQLMVKELTRLNEIMPRGNRTRAFPQSTAVALVSSESLERAAANDERERLEDEQRERDRAAREQWEVDVAEGREQRIRDEEKVQSARRAFYERQGRVLAAVVPRLQTDLADGDVVLIGTPPRNPEWPARFFAPILSYEGSTHWVEYPINGNDTTADGAAVWTKAGTSAPKLQFIVCPDVRRVSEGLAKTWRDLNVRAYAETEDEASALAEALRWSVDEILVSDTAP